MFFIIVIFKKLFGCFLVLPFSFLLIFFFFFYTLDIVAVIDYSLLFYFSVFQPSKYHPVLLYKYKYFIILGLLIFSNA